jgi:nucleoside 2-deoxyribosyltransferase
MNFYIASKLRNAESVKLVSRALADDGHVLTYDWTPHGPVWREGWERCRQVAVFETEGVKDADVVIVLLPGGFGTHTELGAALALGKPVVMWSAYQSDFDLNADSVAFHYHPQIVQMWGSIPSFIEKLRQFFAQIPPSAGQADRKEKG